MSWTTLSIVSAANHLNPKLMGQRIRLCVFGCFLNRWQRQYSQISRCLRLPGELCWESYLQGMNPLVVEQDAYSPAQLDCFCCGLVGSKRPPALLVTNLKTADTLPWKLKHELGEDLVCMLRCEIAWGQALLNGFTIFKVVLFFLCGINLTTMLFVCLPVNRLLYQSTRVIYYLYCSYRLRPLTVQLKWSIRLSRWSICL